MLLFVLVLVGLSTTNNKQTKYMQLATRLGVRVPAAAKYFFISMFDLGIANDAKVGLKLRLLTFSFL